MPQEMPRNDQESLNQQLLNAVKEKNSNKAKLLLDGGGVNVNYTNNDNKTLLSLAIQNLDLPMVELLLQCGANPNYKRPLNPNSSIIELFLQSYADPYCNSPLYSATNKANYAMVELLLKHGADPNYGSPLCLAACEGNSAIVELLLKYNANVNYQDSSGNTALHYATKMGHIKIAELLIVNNANLNAKNWWSKQTPLDLIIKNGHVHIIKLLLDKNIISVDDVLSKEEYSFTAVYGMHVNLVKFLLEKGMDANIKDRSGNTLLHRAANRKYMGVIEWLFTSSAYLNNERNCNKKVAELLIKNNADPNAKNHNDALPLHIAAETGNTGVAELLMENKANPNAKDCNGRVPLHYAAKGRDIGRIARLIMYFISNADLSHEQGRAEITKLLLEHGAKVNVKDKSGVTPLQEAIKTKSGKVAELLTKDIAKPNTILTEAKEKVLSYLLYSSI